MGNLAVTTVAIFIMGVVGILGLNLGEVMFHPKEQTIATYNIKNERLFFNGKDVKTSKGNYSFSIPSNVSIKSNDIVAISYNFDRGEIKKITEIFINKKTVWNNDSEIKIN